MTTAADTGWKPCQRLLMRYSGGFRKPNKLQRPSDGFFGERRTQAPWARGAETPGPFFDLEKDVMEGINRVTLAGNLASSPELRFTNSGEPVLGFRLATSEVYFDKDKNKKDHTEFHSCSLWGKRGEALSKFLGKGDPVIVEGSLRHRTWEKDGNKGRATDVKVTNIVLCGGRGGSSSSDTSRQEQPTASPGAFDDPDVPF